MRGADMDNNYRELTDAFADLPAAETAVQQEQAISAASFENTPDLPSSADTEQLGSSPAPKRAIHTDETLNLAVDAEHLPPETATRVQPVDIADPSATPGDPLNSPPSVPEEGSPLEISESPPDLAEGQEEPFAKPLTIADTHQVLELLGHMSQGIQALDERFRKRIQYDEGKEKTTDRLHAELQEYKNDLYGNMLRPLLYDIAEVMDDIRKASNRYRQGEDSSGTLVVEDVLELLEIILEKYDVERYASEPGVKFESRRHRMIKTVPGDSLEQNGLVAESLGPGYLFRGKALYAEKVYVYKYDIQTNKTEDNNNV